MTSTNKIKNDLSSILKKELKETTKQLKENIPCYGYVIKKTKEGYDIYTSNETHILFSDIFFWKNAKAICFSLAKKQGKYVQHIKQRDKDYRKYFLDYLSYEHCFKQTNAFHIESRLNGAKKRAEKLSKALDFYRTLLYKHS